MTGMALVNIDIKAFGGRSVILTCPSKDEMENMIKEHCLQRWFSETNPWDGQAACAERFVWLCCYGIPLNVWSNISFKSIGELWGSFISTDEATMKMSYFAEAIILIATNIFKEIDEWIIVDVEGKSYKVKVMEDSCDQPHETEKQIPRVSLASSLHSNEESKAAEEDKEDEVDTSVSGSETNGPSPVAELFAQQGSEGHRDSPIFNEDLGVAAKDVNLDCQSNDINSISTHDLESIVEDSLGLLSLFQEVEDTGVKPLGDKILSHIVPMVTDPMKPINEGKEAWNDPIVFDSGNNIRASQFAGINLMVDFRPKEDNGKNRSQPFGEDLVSTESSRTSVPSHEVSSYIADTPEQEQYRIAEELQETIIAGTKLGIKYDDACLLRMKKMIEQEAKDLEIILRDNPFAPLQRNKLQRNESRVRHRSSLAF
ncbi:hypothetical protein RHSIM_Rhsim05G0113800 [Rhododendron simsii]|uniref:DUF4283 domain-containing protein n=1 Tax=Rhododendron simsii TaxID=118357 RepID=A0A834GXJ8_RHOSS|nr:hypothetical protein RHSIM_Rhsim05G0113800 [Rhododendron simsii]